MQHAKKKGKIKKQLVKREVITFNVGIPKMPKVELGKIGSRKIGIGEIRRKRKDVM
jgi:hypothetical protein